jgi:asparagine synthase (glutamine-hydrolysing)
MCGFVSIIDLRRSSPAPNLIAMAETMANEMVHRGPDDHGVWIDERAGLALAHRRLSILDLSPLGHQPMASSSGRFTVVFNGEIYNFRSLRDELASTGATFCGHSDTEVVLAACEHWGLADTLPRLVGMFAIALWDSHARVLHLARDRMGEKPLYYGWLSDGTFVAASELKALRAHPSFAGEVDRDALSLYLRHGYLPAPHAIWRGIRKLPPGTVLSLKTETPAERPQPVSWWSARAVATMALVAPRLADAVTAEAELDRLLRDVVGGQLVADVPVGAFLSGGIDSSTVVAIMQAMSSRPVRTFTIGFREQGYDEAGHAMAVARHLGTEHTELYVTADEARAIIPRLPTIYDEPFADSSQIPTFLVSQLARRHVTVALTGDGGDELFGGYHRYFLMRSLWQKMNLLPHAVRRAVSGMITMIPPGGWDGLLSAVRWALPARYRHGQAGDKAHKLARVLRAGRPEEIYLLLVSQWDGGGLVIGGNEPATVLDDPTLLHNGDLVERMMLLDQLTYLPGDILAKVDRAAMAVSLETRVPLLDHRLVEFAWRLAPELRVQGGVGKLLLRRVLDRYVPRRLIERPKMGFGVPLADWLRGPLREWAEALLSEERLRREGFFHPEPIRVAWSEHLSGRRNWQYRLWAVLMFQAWWEGQKRG